MAELIRVDDPTDPRLADYVSLRDVQLRGTSRPSTGSSSPRARKSCAGRSTAGYPVRSFLMAERWLTGLADDLAAAGDVPCYVVGEDWPSR